MAAGRRVSYGNNELRDRESDFNGFRKEEFSSVRNANRNSLERARDVREERGRVRQKDLREKEVANGGYYSSSSRSDSGGSGGGLKPTVKAMDREPGELSSESGSEDGIESEKHLRGVENPEGEENGKAWPSLERKRKFSPIVWDIDDEKKMVSRGRVDPSVASLLPPPPPLPKSNKQSPNGIRDGGVRISPIRSNNMDESPFSIPTKLSVTSESVGHSVSQSTGELGLSAPQEHIGKEAEQVKDEEDYVPTWNISSSRWADGNDSPVDEAENVDVVPKRRKTPSSRTSEIKLSSKSVTPELGELKKEGSGGAIVRLSDSDELSPHARSYNGEDIPGNDSDRSDSMEIDEELNNNNISATQLDTGPEEEDDLSRAPEPVAPQRIVNMLQGCRSVDEFERLNKIDEGTYGVVYRARDKKTGEIVALKKVKMEKEREGFPLTALREINILLSFHHPSVVDVKAVVVGSSLDSIFMVMEYMEHDLKGLMETMKQPFSQSEVKCLMLQLLEGLKHLHDNWVLHRDMKTSNLLMNNRGELKICDFGLARQYGSPLKPYTHLVVTLWYRAPELLLGGKLYSTAIDMWSLGCIMAELLSKEPLFNGKNELDQLDKIFRTLGTPNESIWPGFTKLPGVKVNFVKHQYNLLRKKFPATSFTGSPVLSDSGFDLLNKLLAYDPEKRITAEDALNHEWFREVPLPKSKDFMPTFPAQHAQDRRARRLLKSPDPLEEQRRKELKQVGLGTGGLFG